VRFAVYEAAASSARREGHRALAESLAHNRQRMPELELRAADVDQLGDKFRVECPTGSGTGDNGAGLGASHQNGWTGLVAQLIAGRR